MHCVRMLHDAINYLKKTIDILNKQGYNVSLYRNGNAFLFDKKVPNANEILNNFTKLLSVNEGYVFGINTYIDKHDDDYELIYPPPKGSNNYKQ